MTKPKDSVQLLNVEITPHPEAVKAGLRAAEQARLKCPNCNRPVHPVTQSNSYLNSDQFDAIRAGDYYCESCPEEAGTAKKSPSGYAYFWERDIEGAVEERLAANYFSKYKQTKVAHDELLVEFGITEPDDFVINDCRGRLWATYEDSGGTSYLRYRCAGSGTTAFTVASLIRKGGYVLVKGFYSYGGLNYYLFTQQDEVDNPLDVLNV